MTCSTGEQSVSVATASVQPASSHAISNITIIIIIIHKCITKHDICFRLSLVFLNKLTVLLNLLVKEL